MKSDHESDCDWSTVVQMVVPSAYSQHILALTHGHPWSGHLGATKTYHRILGPFFWPGLKTDVLQFCHACRTCQIVGKPNQVVPPAPLCPIPALSDRLSM